MIETVPWPTHERWVNSLTEGASVRKMSGITGPPDKRTVSKLTHTFERELEPGRVVSPGQGVAKEKRRFLVRNRRTGKSAMWTIGMLYPATTYADELPQEDAP